MKKLFRFEKRMLLEETVHVITFMGWTGQKID